MAVPTTAPGPPSTSRPARRAFDRAAVVLFCALITAPAVDQAVRPASARDSRAENRAPQPRPPLPATLDDFRLWPERFELWHRDTFGLRDHLLGARNSALVGCALAPNPVLDVGENGWIFYRDDGAFDAHRGVLTRCGTQVDAWVRALDERQRRLASRGVRLLFVLAPDKETIYPELCRPEWKAIGPTLCEVFVSRLAQRTQVEFVDLRPALTAAKLLDRPEVEDHVYVPRGTHWSARGALVATNAILDALRDAWPAVGALDPAGFEYEPMDAADEDSWMRMLYAPGSMRPSWDLRPREGWGESGDPWLDRGRPTIVERSDASLPSVHLLHDSYGTTLFPYLALRCRRVRAEWRGSLNESVVARERPDVVVVLRAERMLSRAPDADLRAELEEPEAPPLDAATLRWSLGAGAAPRALGSGRFAEDGAWTSAVWSDRFEVDAGRALAPDERAFVRFDVDAPHDGQLEIGSNVAGASDFPQARRRSFGLARGANRRAVELALPEHGGRLLVRFAPVGTWRIRALELHALPASAGAR